MIGSNINKILVCVFILIIKVGISYAQAPVITPNPAPIILNLDATGNINLVLSDVGTVQPDALNPNPTIVITPTQFNCFNLGKQQVIITASDYNLPVTFNQPTGIVIDKAGNVYITDAGNHKIRELSTNGDVSDFAGSGTVGVSDGMGTAASFDTPEGIAIDGTGNLYVTDGKAGLIRKITPQGLVSTLAGTAYSKANDNGTGLGVSFDMPYGIAVDSHGNVFVADAGGNKIRKVTPDGHVTTFAGSVQGFNNGPGATALFYAPAGITVDGSDNLYVADTYNNRIRKITPAGNVTTIAGSGGPGLLDGVGTNAYFNLPFNLTVDGSGNIYVADTQNQDIRKIDINNSVTTIAGDNTTGNKDGYAKGLNPAVAEFNTPLGLALTATGDLLIGDVNNNEIRQYSAGYTSTLAGNGTAGAVNGNIYAYNAHTSTDTVDVVVRSYLKITTVYNDTTLTPCDNVMPDFIKIKPPQVMDNCNNNTPPHQVPAAGSPLASNAIIPVDIIVEDATGLYDTVTFNVITKNIYAMPAVTITPSTTDTVCANTPLTFSAATANAAAPAFQWQVNGSNKGTNDSTFTSTFNNGDVVTCSIISSTCGVPASSNSYSTKVVQPPTVSFSGGITIKYNNTVQLNPVITGNIVSYKWSPADGLSSDDIASPVLTGQKTANYQLTVTSAAGCVGTGTVNVQVIDNVIVPNTFTPNGDGINDLWDIAGLVLYPNCVVSIYNRYGSLLYHSAGYPKSWDGTYKGKELAAGTYYYIIDLKTGKPKIAGSVTIIR